MYTTDNKQCHVYLFLYKLFVNSEQQDRSDAHQHKNQQHRIDEQQRRTDERQRVRGTRTRAATAGYAWTGDNKRLALFSMHKTVSMTFLGFFACLTYNQRINSRTTRTSCKHTLHGNSWNYLYPFLYPFLYRSVDLLFHLSHLCCYLSINRYLFTCICECVEVMRYGEYEIL